MAKLNIIDNEIARRTEANTNFVKAEADLIIAIEQFNKLDEFYREQEKASRELLECQYKEDRHFSDVWPIVYSFAQVEQRPFFKDTDATCNPYFPITKIQDGTIDGIAPYEAVISKTGAWQRQRTYGATTEPTLRGTAMTVLGAFPDITDETGTGFCTGGTGGADQSTCETGGGTWTPPGYIAGDTATEKLRAALDPWRVEVVLVMSDLCNDTGAVENDFWQDILDNIDDVLAAIQVDVVYPTQTVDFTPSSTEDIARDYLLANIATFTTHIDTRSTTLQSNAIKEEQVFFGLVGLRLHQVNGSYSKLQNAKSQQGTTSGLISDNDKAIASLNLMKVKNS